MFDGLLPASTFHDGEDTLFDQANSVLSLMWRDDGEESDEWTFGDDIDIEEMALDLTCAVSSESESDTDDKSGPSTLATNSEKRNLDDRISASDISANSSSEQVNPQRNSFVDADVLMDDVPQSLPLRLPSDTQVYPTKIASYSMLDDYPSEQVKGCEPYERWGSKRDRIVMLEAQLIRLEKENHELRNELFASSWNKHPVPSQSSNPDVRLVENVKTEVCRKEPNLSAPSPQKKHKTKDSLNGSLNTSTSHDQKRVYLVYYYLQKLVTGGPDEFEECIHDIMDPNIVIYTPSFGYHKGHENVLYICRQWFSSCPDLTIMFDSVGVDEYDRIVGNYHLSGTFVSKVPKVPILAPSGQLIQFSGKIQILFNNECKVCEFLWLWKDGYINNKLFQRMYNFCISKGKGKKSEPPSASTTSPETTSCSPRTLSSAFRADLQPSCSASRHQSPHGAEAEPCTIM